jgi:hypothetical protein
MRTTLSIDDDVLLAAQERARRERRAVGAVLSDLARQALTAAPVEVAETAGRHGFRPLPHRGAPVTNAHIDRMLEEDVE